MVIVIKGSNPYELKAPADRRGVFYSKLVNVTELAISFEPDECAVYVSLPLHQLLHARLGACFSNFPKLKQLTCCHGRWEWRSQSWAKTSWEQQDQQDWDATIPYFDKRPEVQAVLRVPKEDGDSEEYDKIQEYIWNAEEGDVLAMELNNEHHAINTIGSALSEFWKGIESEESFSLEEGSDANGNAVDA